MSEVKDGPAKEPTAEEIAAMEAQREEQKKELMDFYEKELPFLRLQKEYEESLTAIEGAKLQRQEMQMIKLQMMQQMQQMQQKPEAKKAEGEELELQPDK